jgi:hypothetical protein
LTLPITLIVAAQRDRADAGLHLGRGALARKQGLALPSKEPAVPARMPPITRDAMPS